VKIEGSYRMIDIVRKEREGKGEGEKRGSM